MIDFRYHLVSIVSIFLALAVGIVLGAGPLQGEIGDTLSNEVAGLREDKVRLNAQLEDANTATEAGDSYIGETNPEVLAGVLQDRRVALVVLPGSDAALTEATSATLRSAGASVASTTSVSETWVTTQEATAAVRDTAVQDAATRAGVDLTETGAVAPRDVLLAALLTTPAQAGSTAVAASTATAGLEVLSAADLIEIDTEGFELADLVVVISGTVTQGDLEARRTAAERWVDLAIAFDDRSAGRARRRRHGDRRRRRGLGRRDRPQRRDGDGRRLHRRQRRRPRSGRPASCTDSSSRPPARWGSTASPPEPTPPTRRSRRRREPCPDGPGRSPRRDGRAHHPSRADGIRHGRSAGERTNHAGDPVTLLEGPAYVAGAVVGADDGRARRGSSRSSGPARSVRSTTSPATARARGSRATSARPPAARSPPGWSRSSASASPGSPRPRSPTGAATT